MSLNQDPLKETKKSQKRFHQETARMATKTYGGPITRRFNSETYAIQGTGSGLKSECKKIQADLDSRGVKTRITHCKSRGYEIWASVPDMVALRPKHFRYFRVDTKK